MVADRLVAEPLALEVEQDPVLAVVEGEIGELVRVVVGDLRRDQVAVEAGVRRSERGTRRQAEAKAVADAVRVRAQRQIGGERADVLCPQGRIAPEAAGGEQRGAGADHTLLARSALDLGADHGSVLDQQPLRRAPREHLAALSHQPVAGEQIVGHVGLGSPPVTEHGDRVGDMDTERAHPFDCIAVTLDDSVESSGSASGLTSRMTSTVGAVHTKPAYIAEPPIPGPFSTRTTLAPSVHARAAALIPAMPPPKTRRSTIESESDMRTSLLLPLNLV